MAKTSTLLIPKLHREIIERTEEARIKQARLKMFVKGQDKNSRFQSRHAMSRKTANFANICFVFILLFGNPNNFCWVFLTVKMSCFWLASVPDEYLNVEKKAFVGFDNSVVCVHEAC